MIKTVFSSLLFVFSLSVSAQYTETINSNRPGNSQGAFAVGNQVLQLETGLRLGNDNHDLLNTDTNLFGVDYELRYGAFMEQLEVNIRGSYLRSNQHVTVGGQEEEYKFSNFEYNTIGVKYLIYDPYKYDYLEKPSIRSWKANHRFKWKSLIPAVSAYAGANISFGDNPYLAEGESKITPQVGIITQNNWGTWVFVMNFVGDKLGADYPTYAGLFTLTHTLNQNLSLFGEYQVLKSDLYSDNIFRAGGAYLFTRDLQVDLSGLVNFKNTPSRWQVAVGISYRYDMHSSDEMLLDDGSGKKKKDKKDKKGKKDKNKNNDGEEKNEGPIIGE